MATSTRMKTASAIESKKNIVAPWGSKDVPDSDESSITTIIALMTKIVNMLLLIYRKMSMLAN